MQAGPVLLARHIQIANFVIDREPHQVRVVQHFAAVIALRPHHLIKRVRDAALHRRPRQPVVMRVLVRNRRNQKCAEELARSILRVTVAHVPPPATHARPVCRMGIGTHENCRVGRNRESVEWIDHVAHREPSLLSRRKFLHRRPIQKTRIPVNKRCQRQGSALTSR